MITLWAVYQYWVDEGEIVKSSRKQTSSPYEDKTHAEWIARIENRWAGEKDEPYIYCAEEWTIE